MRSYVSYFVPAEAGLRRTQGVSQWPVFTH
jgi:hypothetical protein